MFTAKTYENILNSLLSRVPNDIDKREGSVIHTALAPAAMELAEVYINIEELLSLLFPDTATGEYLERVKSLLSKIPKVASISYSFPSIVTYIDS